MRDIDAPRPTLMRRACVAVAAVTGLLWLAGCATSQVNAQWSDPQFAGQRRAAPRCWWSARRPT